MKVWCKINQGASNYQRFDLKRTVEEIVGLTVRTQSDCFHATIEKIVQNFLTKTSWVKIIAKNVGIKFLLIKVLSHTFLIQLLMVFTILVFEEMGWFEK